MKPSQRSEEEQQLVLEHKLEQKEKEASVQQSGSEEPAKIWKIQGKDANLRTPSEDLALDAWKKKQDPFEL
jgi:hypothetical protein